MKARQLGVKLTGSRNQCSGCWRIFTSNSAFDKHRTGAYGVDRRCRTDDEMIAIGMFKGGDGFWRVEAYDGHNRYAESDGEEAVEHEATSTRIRHGPG